MSWAPCPRVTCAYLEPSLRACLTSQSWLWVISGSAACRHWALTVWSEAPLSVTGAFMLSPGYFKDCAHVGSELLTVILSVTICSKGTSEVHTTEHSDLGWARASMHKALGATQKSQKATRARFCLQESEPFYSHLADKQSCAGGGEFKGGGGAQGPHLPLTSGCITLCLTHVLHDFGEFEDWGSRPVLWVEYS